MMEDWLPRCSEANLKARASSLQKSFRKTLSGTVNETGTRENEVSKDGQGSRRRKTLEHDWCEKANVLQQLEAGVGGPSSAILTATQAVDKRGHNVNEFMGLHASID
jgi:hypothetical protein